MNKVNNNYEFKSFNTIKREMTNWSVPKKCCNREYNNTPVKTNTHINTNNFASLYESDDEDELIDINNNMIIYNKKRTNAFQIFQNKKMIADILHKTKMCNRINCNKVNCNFAHSKDELRNPKCIFDESCQYIHSKTNPCPFLHSCETFESFQIRTGLKRPGKNYINIKEINLNDLKY